MLKRFKELKRCIISSYIFIVLEEASLVAFGM